VNKKIRRAGITVLVAAGFGAVTALIIRDQITRRQRDLFSGSGLRRLAALGHISRAPASVDAVNLLRDFIAWESKDLLREQAVSIAARMEEEVAELILEPKLETV
jgi:hypothetical protein|tara:strand:- start:12986 stop:13300 length:315 start_codon:yes stop_codon:yes gene_type:complete